MFYLIESVVGSVYLLVVQRQLKRALATNEAFMRRGDIQPNMATWLCLWPYSAPSCQDLGSLKEVTALEMSGGRSVERDSLFLPRSVVAAVASALASSLLSPSTAYMSRACTDRPLVN
jgi:hypothetical protein